MTHPLLTSAARLLAVATIDTLDRPVCPCRAGIATTPPATCRNARSSEPSQSRVALRPEGTRLADWPLASGDLSAVTCWQYQAAWSKFIFLTPPKDAAIHCTKKPCYRFRLMAICAGLQRQVQVAWHVETPACLKNQSQPLSDILFIYLFAFFCELKSTFKLGTAIHLRAFIQFVSVNLVHYPHQNKYFEHHHKLWTFQITLQLSAREMRLTFHGSSF